MAKIDNQSFRLSGKIGDKVYYSLNGKQVVRKKPSPRTTVPSEKELQHRSKFAFISKFLLPLKSLISQSYKPAGMTPFNMAVSANFKHAVTGSHPNWKIDFSKFKLGEGEVTGFSDLRVSPLQGGQLLIEWNGKSQRKRSSSRDRLWVAVYCETLQKWLTGIGDACRKDGIHNFYLDMSGYSVHVYLGFTSDFWEGSSDSHYIGEVQII